MEALRAEGIDKSFFGIPVLRGVDLTLRAGEVHGLIGENGAGKSTLMNVLGGVVRRDSGVMTLAGEPYDPHTPTDAGRRGIAFIHQELNLFRALSIAENLAIGSLPTSRLGLVRGRELRRRASQLLSAVGLDVPPAWPLERLSPGEQQLVEIAGALGRDAAILIFDEPTTSLTAREISRLFELIARLRSDGRAVVYISHDLADVKRLCDTMTILRDGRVVANGPARSFEIPEMIQAMVGRRLAQIFPPSRSTPRAERLLDVEDVSRRGIVEAIHLSVSQGESVGLFGLMGSGRTELARILLGLDPMDRGRIRLSGATIEHLTTARRVRAGMAFVTENRRAEGLMMGHGVEENVTLAALPRFTRAGLVERGSLTARLHRLVAELRLKVADTRRQPVRSLSGGNQQKVVLGKWLLAQPRLFILDEPTRGVDVGAKREIYGLMRELAAEGAGLLVISSEIEELIGLCDRIYVMARGEIVQQFTGESGFSREVMLSAAFGHVGAAG